MVCSRESHLACLWERISWQGIQSSSVICSPCPVSFKLPGTFTSGVGVSMTMVGIMVCVDWGAMGAMVGGWCSMGLLARHNISG